MIFFGFGESSAFSWINFVFTILRLSTNASFIFIFLLLGRYHSPLIRCIAFLDCLFLSGL